ncbi:hypothetical protein TRFO_16888 [Tritrichomonas foetus]|uniref:Polymorphic outer membrane protein n=1 Tax=Tritrichomonas foetus TaxID=1144522 RepID=A0A1J4KTN2_9EUKA|nr:hypothetical protein TRFO_16888 [Tritrichomonas foetus]|eukprot:OHT13124.1 hypothetical protein TRFO_16888 [Tritrichomonas foetus]
MIFLVISISFSNLPQNKKDLHAEDPPKFQEIPQKNKKINITGIDELSSSHFTKSGATRRYEKISFFIDSSNFTSCFAFGETYQKSSGGGLFLMLSSVSIFSSYFQSNMAHFGGSISSVTSTLHIENTHFENDSAFFNGGSISFIYYEEALGSMIDASFLSINNQFEKCSAFDNGGAVAISDSNSVYFQNSVFDCCSSGHSGGALFLSMCVSSLFSSSFIECTSGSKISVIGKKKAERRLSIPKGGGAILVFALNQEQNQSNFYIQECCFAGNHCENGETGPGGGGFDILLAGDIYFFSYKNAFTHPENVAIQHSVRLNFCQEINAKNNCSNNILGSIDNHFGITIEEILNENLSQSENHGLNQNHHHEEKENRNLNKLFTGNKNQQKVDYNCHFFINNRTYYEFHGFSQTNTFYIPTQIQSSSQTNLYPVESNAPTKTKTENLATTGFYSVSFITFIDPPDSSSSDGKKLPVIYIVGISIIAGMSFITISVTIIILFFKKKLVQKDVVEDNPQITKQILDDIDTRYSNINPTLSPIAAASRQDFLNYGFGDPAVEL